MDEHILTQDDVRKISVRSNWSGVIFKTTTTTSHIVFEIGSRLYWLAADLINCDSTPELNNTQFPSKSFIYKKTDHLQIMVLKEQPMCVMEVGKMSG